ncbi:MAG: glycosyltransferase [Anaerolineae bacterium]|nr:glycosyltransferase [Anaerolineae bacterium]
MRILIDLQGAQTESRFRGIGRYSMALTEQIVQQADSHDVWVVLNNNFPETLDTIKSNFNGLVHQSQILTFSALAPVTNSAQNTWRVQTAQLLREAFLANLKPDIVYVTSLIEGFIDDAVTSVGLWETPGKTAVTLYDLIPLLNRDTYLIDQQTKNRYYEKIEFLKRADILLSISEYARQECIDSLRIAPEHIVNISTAASDKFKKVNVSKDEKKLLFQQYKITRPFIMYTGGFDARKNLPNLFEAISLLPSRLLKNYQVLIAGKAPQDQKLWLEAQSAKFGLKNQVIIADYVPDDDLVKLYSTCELFVFPSIHEGFGLPALEAMSCGAPVIGSNRTSIPEVIERKDALFDPTKPELIAKKIAETLSDDNFRRSLREYGLEQSKKFSWKESAKRALAAFEAIAPNSNQNRSFFLPDKKHYDNLINAISEIPDTPIGPTNDDLINTARAIFDNEKTVDRVLRACELLNEKLKWRIEGTFHDNYSLSLLNRETARALTKLGHEVAVWSSNQPGFYIPEKDILSKYLAENPDIAQMYQRAEKIDDKNADVVSRNIYPPYVSDMKGRINLLHHYAWEESGFPGEWVHEFNNYLQGITCLSNHVQKTLIDHGVNIPLSVSSCGVDHWERVIPDKNFQIKAKKFRFLHVSSCFPRKGADILLDAYGQCFTNFDDVSLIIKTFKNPHNQIHELLAYRKKNNHHFPEVVIIEEDLTDGQLKSLYEQCHVMVGPSRGEGFGLPFAEAMLSGLPVITTRWGGQLDFCNDETAWLIDYKFEQAQTHFELFDSVWAEPDSEDLARKMREAYTCSMEKRGKKADIGRRLLLEKFLWAGVAQRVVESARNWASIPEEPHPNIGWITTWNTKCGIATYSAHLLRSMPNKIHILAAHTDTRTGVDHAFITRCWHQDTRPEKDDLNQLSKLIDEKKLETLVIQFNYVFFDFEKLNVFLEKQIDAGRIVIIIFHSTQDPDSIPGKKLRTLMPALARCQRLLVHSINDLNNLKDIGLIDNVTLFPHGVLEYTPGPKAARKEKMVASYGFFLPHKGLLELIDAFAQMIKSGEKVKLLMVNAEYPVPASAELIQKARAQIEKLNIGKYVNLTTEYLPDKESLDLVAEADLIVFPYQETGESSSAAVRYGLATGRPVAVTPLAIFDDVSPAVLRLPGVFPDQIARGITEILHNIEKNTTTVQRVEERANRWRRTHYYYQLSARLYGMIQALYRKK